MDTYHFKDKYGNDFYYEFESEEDAMEFAFRSRLDLLEMV